MITIKSFVFNPFHENTYVLSNEQLECWIVDAGCCTDKEREKLKKYIDDNGLNPQKLLNTHCHLDHIYGNHFIYQNYGLLPQWHKLEDIIAKNASMAARMFGVDIPQEQDPGAYLSIDDVLCLGASSFRILYTPGHSPGSICFYNEKEKFVIVGDVLFKESIGRTDLPGGNYDTLIHSIRTQLFTLPDDTKVFNGHGFSTSIGHEKKYNPFLQ